LSRRGATANSNYRIAGTAEIERHLRKHRINYQKRAIPAPENADQDKNAKLEAVKRWFHEDWQPPTGTASIPGGTRNQHFL